MVKKIIKETMLSLEGASLQSAREKYFDYVADARLDRSEPIESDEQAQAEIASDLSEALDDTLHDHTDKLDKLREIDFGPSRPLMDAAVLSAMSAVLGSAIGGAASITTAWFTQKAQGRRESMLPKSRKERFSTPS